MRFRIARTLHYGEQMSLYAIADSLMDEISLFVEENCDAEIMDEQREIR